MTIKEVYDILDAYAPFSLQESYDRSGLLAGDPAQEVSSVMLTLDITTPVVLEAAEKHADLIVSHHPVIWDPLKSISPAHPVWHLVRHGIGAVCTHTCLDIAEGGLNDCFGDLLQCCIPLDAARAPLSVLSGGRTLGSVAALAKPADADLLAAELKTALHCSSLRYRRGKNAASICRIAWCTGSGGDLMRDAIKAGADALITGDCKHSVWAEAQNLDFTLFDCGHFETEVLAVGLLRRILQDAAPGLTILDSEAGTKPFFTAI